ncbi:hypothetical protein ACWGCP_15405 [Streptomyces niveus]
MSTHPPSALPEELAAAIGAVLADISGSADNRAEIRALTDAMIRLLAGAPLRSDGKLTIKSLATEANLRRNKLTHKHTGLKDLFYALVTAQEGRPAVTEQLYRENETLRADLARVKEERARLKAQAKQFARVVQILEVENHQLRQSAEQSSTISVFPGLRN